MSPPPKVLHRGGGDNCHPPPQSIAQGGGDNCHPPQSIAQGGVTIVTPPKVL